MTTPALTQDEQLTPYIFGKRITRNAAGVVTNERVESYGGCNTGAETHLRPASASSPVRADGSRAPRAWAHRWAVIKPPTGFFSITQPFGSGTREYTFEDVSCAGSHPTSAASRLDTSCAESAGFTWCALTSGGVFPYNVEALAVTKLRNEVLSQRAQWGTTLGEMRQTVKGVSSLCGDILDVVENLAKRSKRTKAEIARFLRDTSRGSKRARKRARKRWRDVFSDRNQREILGRWLEFQFSVKPLLMDIGQSAEALSWLLFEKQQPARFSVRAGASQDWDFTWSQYWPRRVSSAYCLSHTRGTATAQCHYSVVYVVDPTTTTTFQQLGLTNVASVAWELTQFSWMFDYAIGIGDWLNSLVSLDGATFVEGTKSLKGVLKQANRPVSMETINPGTLKGGPRELPFEVGRFSRIVLSDLPGPALHPPVRSRLGLTQLANVLAVLPSLLK